MSDAYDVTVNVLRKARRRDGGGGADITPTPVPDLQELPARMHFYSSASQFRQEIAAARAPVAPQGPGTTTRERRFLYLEETPLAPIRTNDVCEIYDADTGERLFPGVTVNVLTVRPYEYSYQVDVETVK